MTLAEIHNVNNEVAGEIFHEVAEAAYLTREPESFHIVVKKIAKTYPENEQFVWVIYGIYVGQMLNPCIPLWKKILNRIKSFFK